MRHRALDRVLGVLLSIGLVVFPIATVVRADESVVNSQFISASPDLLSAYAVAWNAHKAWSKREGRAINERNLSKFSWSIYVVRRESGSILVSFAPSKPTVRGGSTEYIVDATTFEILEQRFP